MPNERISVERPNAPHKTEATLTETQDLEALQQVLRFIISYFEQRMQALPLDIEERAKWHQILWHTLADPAYAEAIFGQIYAKSYADNVRATASFVERLQNADRTLLFKAFKDIAQHTLAPVIQQTATSTTSLPEPNLTLTTETRDINPADLSD